MITRQSVVATLLALLSLIASFLGGSASAHAAELPVSLASAATTDATIAAHTKGISVTFGHTDDWPSVRWNAPSGTSWDWSTSSTVILEITNPSTTDVTFCLRIDDDPAADGGKHSATTTGTIGARSTQRFNISIVNGLSPEQTGMQKPPPIASVLPGTLLSLNRHLDFSHITSIQIFRAHPKSSARIIVRSIALDSTQKRVSLDGLVDRYGQFTGSDWSGKVHGDADFVVQKQAESKKFKTFCGRDQWGGDANGARFQATGFFRTEQTNGTWWLVDPDGHRFLTIGMNAIRDVSATVVENRENMFSWLPDAADPLARFYGHRDTGMIAGALYKGKTYDFAGANLVRKYGDNYRQQFRDTTLKRLRDWGFNTIGNWSDTALAAQHLVPSVATVTISGLFARVPSGVDYWGKMPDPFDPAFQAAADRCVMQVAVQFKNDPWCLGYFVDNELSWGGGEKERDRYGLAIGTLSLGADSPAKAAFLAQLKDRYGAVQNFNAAWGVNVADWSILQSAFNAPTPLTAAARDDCSAFLTLYAEKYFGTVADAIHRNDSNHLYLGCRFAWFTPEAVEAAAKHSDVISFNIYGWNRGKYAFAEKLRKPLMVGEFHFAALDRGMFSGGLCPVASQAERGTKYAEYVRSVLSEPAFVGCHWFCYRDEPTTGRAGDGENYNIGFVSITDTPYAELITAAKSANETIYQIHTTAHP